MNSRRPIKSCVCSRGFVFDQIGGLPKLSLQWVIVLNVLPAAESWVRNRSLLGSRPRALGCFSKLHSIYAIFCFTFLWHQSKLSRMHATSGTSALSTMYWIQCPQCLLSLKWERERKPVPPKSPEFHWRYTLLSPLLTPECWELLIAPDREALFFYRIPYFSQDIWAFGGTLYKCKILIS